MSIAAMIRRMGEAGATPEAIAIAVEEIEGIQGMLEARRTADRDRKRAQRERQKQANVTGHSEDSPETVTDEPLSLDKSPQTPKIKPLPRVCNNTPHARDWHRLPESWEPTRQLPPKIQAKVSEWPPGALDDELAALHRWAANAKNENGKGKKLDWDKAWQNWIERRHDERYGKQGSGSSASGMGRTIDAAQRFVERGRHNGP